MSQEVDYDTFPKDFLALLIKLKYKCANNVGDIESITFKSNGDVTVKRNVANLLSSDNRKSCLRGYWGKYDITCTIPKSEIDANLLEINENGCFKCTSKKLSKKSISFIELSNNKTRIQKPKNNKRKADDLTDDESNKSLEINTKILKQILDEIDHEIGKDKNNDEKWEFINTRLENVFGHSNILKLPNNDDKKKYLSWISALRLWDGARDYPIKQWVKKAEKAFGPFETKTLSGPSSRKKFKNDIESDENVDDSIDTESVENEVDNTNNERKRMDRIISELLTLQVTRQSSITHQTPQTERQSMLNNIKGLITAAKWKHFLNLDLAYKALKKVINQEPEDNESIVKFKDKKENSVPLGKGACAKKGSLYKLRYTPDCFKEMNQEEFDYFLQKISGNDNLKFDIDDINETDNE
ncbi:19777_t:CDS:2 [Gigaspora margarita]|uniref:19777_t:CDS:1 n=1 Tax=Gigaspora margarita TaxID=4874 RepID=A0ABM8VYH6_GIGMA|nr:19777_t:CDS:2 [Gigaspora margarita]